MPPEDTTDLHREFGIISSLNTLVAVINNEGYPTLASDSWSPSDPYPSDDMGENVLNAVATALVRKSRDLAAMICNPLPSADLVSEPDPYQIYILENMEPVTCPGSESESNSSDGTTPDVSDDKPSSNKDDNGKSSNVPIVTNSDTPDRYFDRVTGLEQCILLKHGESHMLKILDKSKH